MIFLPGPAFPRFSVGTRSKTPRVLITLTKNEQRILRAIFGKGSKAITSYLSERIHLRFERGETDRAALHRSLFSGLGGPILP